MVYLNNTSLYSLHANLSNYIKISERAYRPCTWQKQTGKAFFLKPKIMKQGQDCIILSSKGFD